MPKKINLSNYKNVLLLVLVLGLFSIAFFADAATVTIHPQSAVSYGSWLSQKMVVDATCNSGGTPSSNPQNGGTPTGGHGCVNDQSGDAVSGAALASDNSNTMVRTQNNPRPDEIIFGFGSGLVPAGSTITQIQVVTSALQLGVSGTPDILGNGLYQTRYRIGAAGAFSSLSASHQPLCQHPWSGTTFCSSYTQYTDTFSVALSSANLDQLQVGLRQPSGGRLLVTQLYVVVTYTPPAVAPCAAPFPSGAFCGDYYRSVSPGLFSTLNARVLSEGNLTTPFLNYNPFDATLGQAARCGQQDLCAVRWQGNFNFNAASYTFSVTTDDGIRLYIDGVLRIDQWFDQCCPTYTYTQNMTAGAHLIKVEFYENAGGAESVVGWTQNAVDTIFPTVSISAPAGGSTVSGAAVTVSANAADNIGVVGVQFKDGATNIGAEDTTSPYSVSWNTTVVANGSHTLTAVARDAAGNMTTSAGVSVTVSNVAPDTTAPSTPTWVGSGATAVSSSQINLSWNASTDPIVGGQTTSGVAGYRLYRCQGTGCTPSVQIATILVPIISYSDTTGLSPSTVYVYRVAAYDAANNPSGQSASASATTQAPPPPPNVSGYAWAGNGQNDGSSNNPGIGWIHMSGTAGSDTYGVSVSSASPGVLSGYALANPNDSVAGTNNIGWISFNTNFDESGTRGCPSNNCTAQLDRGNGQVSGWARVCTVFQSGCSGALRASSELGGWDGWIRLRGTAVNGNPYGVLASDCNWSGYAWGGGTVMGWINFRGSGGSPLYSVTGSGDGCATVTTGTINIFATSNGSPWSSGTINYSIAGPTAVPSANYTVPIAHSNLSAGSYTLTYNSGGPVGGFIDSISPCGAGVNPCTHTTSLSAGGSISFTLNFSVPPPPPTAPFATPAPTNACKVINVSWGNALGATGYNINRCPPSPGICSPVASMWPSSPFQDTSASDGITYTYQISSCNAFGCNPASVTTASVTNNAPEVSFNYTPSSNIVVNQLVDFAGNLVGGNPPVSWNWTFAGGNPATGNTQNASSSFSPAGSHAVQLTATNANGSCVVPGSVSVSEGTFGDWCELPPDAPPGTPCP